MVRLDCVFFFFQAEDGIRDYKVTGVQTCALPLSGVFSAFQNAGLDFNSQISNIGAWLFSPFKTSFVTTSSAKFLKAAWASSMRRNKMARALSSNGSPSKSCA